MAYNYRPTSTKEILSRKKKFGIAAAAVYEYVSSHYDKTIVLDPNTQFSVIKVPRDVSKQISIADLKKKLASAGIDLTGVDVQFGNGSGSAGGSSMNAEETAKQENSTRLYCESYVGRGVFPTAAQLAAVYPTASDEWIDTFERQAVAIKRFIGGQSGYEWSRDTGIMPFIESFAKSKCGVSTKDSWNPADIYCVRRSRKLVIQQTITEIGKLAIPTPVRLEMLNEYMRQLLAKKDLIGFSLKKLGKSGPSVEVTNAGGVNAAADIGIVPGSIILDLDLKPNEEFRTGELSFKLKVKSSIVNAQVRAFAGGVRETTQVELTGSGDAAKLGKVSVREAIDPYLASKGLTRRKGSDLPAVGRWTQQTIQQYIDEQAKLAGVQIGGTSINWGSDNWAETFVKATQIEVHNNRTASQLAAKLQAFHWITILHKLDQSGHLKEFLNVLYNGAKKQYSTAGPFVKIS